MSVFCVWKSSVIFLTGLEGNFTARGGKRHGRQEGKKERLMDNKLASELMRNKKSA